MADGEFNVFSISSDGRVCNWILMQNQLIVTVTISLTLPIRRVAGPDGAMVDIKGTREILIFKNFSRLYLLFQILIFFLSQRYRSCFSSEKSSNLFGRYRRR